MAEISLRRSMLFMPASNARALEKAKSLPADGLIFDLEDAVAPDAKADARVQAAVAVSSGDYGGKDLVVRINGLDTEWWRDDLKAVVPAQPFAILVPKVEDPDHISRVEEEMSWHTTQRDAEIWAMIETPKGFLRAGDIAGASDRMTTWVVGTNDLVKDLRASHTRDRQPVITALGLALLHARANGLTILDGVYSNFADTDGFAHECGQARAMGFDGKTLIHPAQIGAANSIFGPDEDELQKAHRMLAAFEEAKAEGKGVAVLDGRMIEELHLEEARRMVAMAEAIAERL